MNQKSLPISLREKQRYLAFQIISKKEFDLGSVVNSIWWTILQLYGEYGTSKFFLWVPSNLYDQQNKKGIMRCGHMHVEDVRAALASIRQINDEPVIIKTLGVTGTIRSAKRKFLGFVDLEDFSK